MTCKNNPIAKIVIIGNEYMDKQDKGTLWFNAENQGFVAMISAMLVKFDLIQEAKIYWPDGTVHDIIEMYRNSK